jgi:hypothetical protein
MRSPRIAATALVVVVGVLLVVSGHRVAAICILFLGAIPFFLERVVHDAPDYPQAATLVKLISALLITLGALVGLLSYGFARCDEADCSGAPLVASRALLPVTVLGLLLLVACLVQTIRWRAARIRANGRR